MKTMTDDQLELECVKKYFPSTSQQDAEGLQALPVIPAKVLAGEVSACDPESFVMKLKLADDYTFAMFNDQKPKVTLGGEEMSCTVNQADRLLECAYPADAVFPAQIKLNVDGGDVNDFNFDGKACQPPVEAPSPILTGEVTYCDAASRVMNLRLVDGFTAGDFTHQVTFGGKNLDCKVSEANPSILACAYPADSNFPSNIQVVKDGTVVNEFEYNGANCVIPEQTKQPGGPTEIVCDPVILAMDNYCEPLP